MLSDYAQRLLKDGFSIGTTFRFSNIIFKAIAIVGQDVYRAEEEYAYKGTKYSISLDFDPDILAAILQKAQAPLRESITRELIIDPVTCRTIPLDPPVKVSITVRLVKPITVKEVPLGPLKIIAVE